VEIMSYKYFKNKDCEYFPCHELKGDHFNCLFCYCPLYHYDCGGKYKDEGVKDCMNCTIPHSKGGYEYVLKILVENMRKAD
jgi:Zn-finger protein